tara:strand:- start:952 stop:1353 length:402 start_codon:yes stop_codon:yes gene_type:complete
MKSLSIELPDKDHSILSRIAVDQDRRLNDLTYLLMARGLESYFCETSVSIKKEHDEYTEEDTNQLKKNKELELTKGWHSLTWEEQKAKGFEYVCSYLHNHEHTDGKYTDPLIDPLAERIKSYAIEGVPAPTNP